MDRESLAALKRNIPRWRRERDALWHELQETPWWRPMKRRRLEREHQLVVLRLMGALSLAGDPDA